MGILLTDKEMESAYGGELPSYEDARRMTKAQLKNVVDKWGSYGEFAGCKMIPVEDWQALLKETGLLEK